MIVDVGSCCSREAAGPARWNPTQAKTGLEWGTQPSLPVERGKSVRNSLAAVRRDNEQPFLFVAFVWQRFWRCFSDGPQNAIPQSSRSGIKRLRSMQKTGQFLFRLNLLRARCAFH
jgi:hypothetical protein